MRKRLAVLVALATWSASSIASAQDFCAEVKGLLTAAQTEFGQIMGQEIGSPSTQMRVFEGMESLHGADACAVAQQTHEGRRFSTSYTCAGLGEDSDQGIRQLAASVSSCLDLTAWAEQQQPDGRGPWISQYGLIRLTISRNRERALALGVEVFRDADGAVMGSPLRGDSVAGDGSHRCTPKSPEQIASLFAMYAARPGAERFEDDQFIGYTNSQTLPVVAFITRPSHPAHPAIIVRSVEERDGNVLIHARGDFAGDCAAFLELLAQVDAMNRNVSRN